MSSYYASKNYVVRLSEGIYEELRRKKSNVHISCFCPGPVKTEFNKVAGVNFAIKGIDQTYAAKYAIDTALKNKMIIMPSLQWKVPISLWDFYRINNLQKFVTTYNERKTIN